MRQRNDKGQFVAVDRGCSVEGCPRPHSGLGLCEMHRWRYRKYGSTDPRPRQQPRMDPLTRLARHVVREGDCLIFKGSLGDTGYGEMREPDGKKILAHRLSYQIFKGVIPAGMIVRHTCDRRACVNPDHLVLGTHGDNTQDKVERGRVLRGKRTWPGELDGRPLANR